ncbi:O-antigen ligase, partial [Alcanivorax sp. HI0083]
SVMALVVSPRERWCLVAWGFSSVVVLGVFLSNSIAFLDGVVPSSWERVRDFCGQIFMFSILSSLFSEDIRLVRFLISGLYAGLFFTTMLFFLLWFSLDDPAQYDWIWGVINFVNIRHLGMFVSAMLFISLWGCFYSCGAFRVASMLGYSISFFFVVWSGGRAAILSTILALLFVAILTMWRQWKIWLCVVLASILSVWISTVFFVDNSSMGIGRFFLYERGGGGLEKVSSGRWSVWLHAVSLIADRPIWGWGGDIYSVVKIRPELSQVHNGFLQVPLEWGLLVGSIFWCGVILLMGRGVYFLFMKRRYSEKNLVLGVGLGGVMLVHCMFDGVVYHGTPFAIFMFSLALVFSVTTKPTVETLAHNGPIIKGKLK